MATKILYCSFCGKTQDEVQKLIAGPDVCICDECTKIAMKIVTDTEAGEVEYNSWSFAK